MKLVEVLAGKILDQFFEERKDTAFYVTESKSPRLATIYTRKPDGTVTRSTSLAQDAFKKKPALLLGGAGLVSTMEDYTRFVMMLAGGGQFDGTRILGRKTVDLMHADHLGDLPRTGGPLREGYGFGLMFAVNLGPGKSGNIGSAGEYL